MSGIDYVAKWIHGPTLDTKRLWLDTQLDEVVENCCNILYRAKKEIYLLVDSPVPEFLKYRDYKVVDMMCARSSIVPTKIVVRKNDENDSELENLFKGYPSVKIFGHLKNEFLQRNKSLQKDYVLIGDDDILFGDPLGRTGRFFYHTSILAREMKSRLNSLILTKE